MSDGKLVLHASSISTCSNGVFAFFKITGLQYEFKEVNILGGDNKTPEFTKLNPFQKVPVLVDDGFVLRESNSITRYLVNSRNVGENLYPKDAKKRALVDIALEYWGQNSGKIFAIAAHKFGKSDATVEQAKQTTDNAIKEFEDVFLSKHKFAGGDQFTLADLPYLFYLQGQINFTGTNYDGHKRLNQYFEDLYAAEPKLKQQVEEYQAAVKKAFAPKQ